MLLGFSEFATMGRHDLVHGCKGRMLTPEELNQVVLQQAREC
jgi:hypothetical protein